MNKLLLIVSLASAMLVSTFAFAQSKSVKVTVTDEVGPVPGASVLIKGTNNGAATDANGIATIPGVDRNTVLVVSFLGYQDQEVTVGDQSAIAVVLKDDTQLLDETVVVGYGTQKKESLTAAITSVRAEDVTKTKQSDVVTSLQGKVPGLLIRQGGGTAGNFTNSISLRGYGAPIVVVDGVVRSDSYQNRNKGADTDLTLAQMNPEDIESISVLKDASASIYGMGAGNGVIMITTKKGTESKRPSVYYSNVFSFGSPQMPKEVGIVDYMKLSNEMADVARFPRPYTQEQINDYATGKKKDFSWWDAALRKFAFSHNHNVSVRGGSDRVTYFISGGYNRDNSLYKAENNYTYDRYTLRGNFTAKLTDDLTLDYQTSFRATFSQDPFNEDSYNERSAQIFNWVSDQDRFTPATVAGNPKHYTYAYGSNSPTNNPLAIMDHDLNYTDKRGRSYTNTINLNYKAPFLKGLTFLLQGAYDFNYNATYNKQTIYPLYDYETDKVVGYGGDKNKYSESVRERERLYGRAQANYNTRIGKHSIGAMLAAELTKNNMRSIGAGREFGDFFTKETISSGLESTATATGTRTSMATAGYMGRINYDYANKYLVELMARYDGTYIYQRGKRWGFFPSYSLGWRMSEESFIKDNLPWVTSLKLRWSDGKTGLTQGSAYAYLSGYTAGTGYVFTDGAAVTGYVNNEIANTVLTWADVRMMDFGIDWNFWRDKFGGTFDIFRRDRKGIAGRSSGSVPTILGVTVPQINIDSMMDVGMELTLTHRNKIGDLNYNVSVTGTYARTKNLHVESQATSQWYSEMHKFGPNGMFGGASTQNRWSNARGLWLYGLEGGRFKNWDEINSSPVKYDNNTGMKTAVPGQYKLLDYNGDGYITGQDIKYTWNEGNAPLQYGLNFGLEYKGFDFNMVWQGATLTSKIIWLLHTFGYGGYNNIYQMYLDRYHVAVEGADPFDPHTEWVEGYWPALMDASDSNTWRPGMYDAPTEFSQKDATYFRLKSFEIGYTLPKKVVSTIGLRSARVFIGGTNWLTLVNKKIKYYDPESAAAMQSNTMPVMRTVNLGLNINF